MGFIVKSTTYLNRLMPQYVITIQLDSGQELSVETWLRKCDYENEDFSVGLVIYDAKLGGTLFDCEIGIESLYSLNKTDIKVCDWMDDPVNPLTLDDRTQVVYRVLTKDMIAKIISCNASNTLEDQELRLKRLQNDLTRINNFTVIVKNTRKKLGYVD